MHTATAPPEGLSKRELYLQLCESLAALVEGESDFVANAANTAALLFTTIPDVNWAGFYITKGTELVLGPFQGKPACVRIPFGRGVCGIAAETGETVVVPDVSDFPGHIVCDPASRSEVVVPLVSWGRVVGVLDLDSALPNRFDEEDVDGLESVAAILLNTQQGEELPEFADEDADEE